MSFPWTKFCQVAFPGLPRESPLLHILANTGCADFCLPEKCEMVSSHFHLYLSDYKGVDHQAQRQSLHAAKEPS